VQGNLQPGCTSGKGDTLNFLIHPFIVPVVEARDFDDEELLASMAQHKFLVAVIA
jgi:hypothetical protein